MNVAGVRRNFGLFPSRLPKRTGRRRV